MIKLIEVGRIQVFLSAPFFYGSRHYPRKYMKYVDTDGKQKILAGGIFRVFYIGWLEIRVFNKELYNKRLENKTFLSDTI